MIVLNERVVDIAHPASIYYYDDSFGLHIEMYLKGNVDTYKYHRRISYFELLECKTEEVQIALIEKVIKDGRDSLLNLVATGPTSHAIRS